MATPTVFTVGNYDLSQDLVNKDTKLVTNTETPGGFSTCTFQTTKAVKLADKIVIYNPDYRAYPFVGRVDNVHKTSTCFEITGSRSTRDTTFTKNLIPQSPTHPSGETSSRVYNAGTQYMQAIRDALALCAYVGDSGSIADPGLQFVNDSNDYGLQDPEQVWNGISSLTNNLITPWLWWVRGFANTEVFVAAFQDFAARYYVELPEDQIDETYSLDSIINRVTVSYGHDQVVTVPDVISYAAIKILRDKSVNASSNITRIEDARALAYSYLNKFGQFRSINDNLTIKCDQNKVQSVSPCPISDALPLELVEAGRGIYLNNRPASLAPYNLALKYITRTTYTWDTGVLQLACGELVGLGSNIQLAIDYNVNRLYFGPYTGPVARPLADADLIPTYGPELRGDVPSSFGSGIPTFIKDNPAEPNAEIVYNGVIHPALIADKGLEINYSFDVTETGWKGGTWSIPGRLTEVKASLWKSDAAYGLQVDTVVFEIYTRRAGSNPVFLTKVLITNQKEVDLILSSPYSLPASDYQIVFKLTTAATSAEVINISLHGPKLYPGLKV